MNISYFFLSIILSILIYHHPIQKYIENVSETYVTSGKNAFTSTLEVASIILCNITIAWNSFFTIIKWNRKQILYISGNTTCSTSFFLKEGNCHEKQWRKNQTNHPSCNSYLHITFNEYNRLLSLLHYEISILDCREIVTINQLLLSHLKWKYMVRQNHLASIFRIYV